VNLRPYQITLRDELRACFREGAKRVLAVSPTGSGKTTVFAFVTQGSVQKGNRTYVIAHRSEILDQISATLGKVGVHHGFIQAGKPARQETAMVASIQTLARRIQDVPVPDFVVVDEVHHGVSAQYMSMFAAWPKANFLGVTATPERLDGRGLGAIFQRMVLGPQVQWLIDNRFLAKPVYFAPEKAVDMTGVRKVAGDFDRSQLADLMDKPTITGNAVAHYRKYCPGMRAVAFCVSVAHAEHVAEQFRSAGITAASIDGKLDPDTRKQRVKDLDAGKIQVLTSCELISEGFDLPAVGAAILLRPTASLAMHLQQVGRALRPKGPEGGQAIILDHVGNCLRHGLAEEAREWSLDGREKRKAKEQSVETKQCESCYAIFTGNQCPQCGTERTPAPREIEETDGELQQIDAEEMARRYQFRREEGLCRSLADLVALGKARGYKPGWAHHRWTARSNNRRAA
jgi:superfamily II DNA or RNA helicase